MDNRPIGVFDSGLGGLTAVREIMRVLPGEDIVYFGDTGRVPYGTRSPETILKYARQDIRFLMSFDIKAIVVACGTVSSVALGALIGEFPVRIRGVLEGSVKKALEQTRNNRVAVIGTNATIKSGAYVKLLKEARPELEVIARPCPLLVPLVENGRFKKDDPVTTLVLREYMKDILEFGADTMILGCTHYPLLWDLLNEATGYAVTLVDPGAQCAARLAEELSAAGALSGKQRGASCGYYVSDSVDSFGELASSFLGSDVTGRVERVEIERY